MGEPESYVSSSHTVAELKAMCKENGLPINGKKAELLARLNEFYTGESVEEESISLEEETISLEEEVVSLNPHQFLYRKSRMKYWKPRS